MQFKSQIRLYLSLSVSVFPFRMSLEEYLVLHVREGVAVPRSSLSAVALGFQLLKIIEAAPTLRLQELGDFLQRHSALRLQKA